MSYRNDNGASYDRTLLSSVRTVPEPTRAERQEGYNEGRNRHTPIPPNDGPRVAHGEDVTSTGGPGYVRREELNFVELKLPVPWYRRRWNVIVIVVVVLIIIIGAAVGGAVGGTRSQKSTSTESSSNTSGSSGPMGGNVTQQEQAPNASGSAAESTSALPGVGPTPTNRRALDDIV